MELTTKTKLHLRNINIQKDNKNYIVEDCAIQEFYEMPKVCIDALELIKDGKSLGDIEQILLKVYPNEDINLVDFAQQLIDLDLIDSVNGEKLHRNSNIQINQPGFQWIPEKLGRLFFNKYTKYFYPLLLIINILIFIFNPTLFPHYKDLFISDIMSINMVVYGILSLLLVLIHEMGHILAIRSYGFPTRLEIGNRLFFIVFETDLSLAWKLPPTKRNILYLAGVYFDTVILFLALFLKLFIPFHSNLVLGFLGLIIFDTVVRIIFQACIYMKTDFYFLFENLTGSYNIMDNGIKSLKQLFSTSKTKNSELFKGEEKIVKWYTIFYLLGVVITITLFIFYYLPQLVFMAIAIIPGFGKPIGDFHFWDAVMFSIEIIVALVLLSYSVYKNNRIK